MIASLTGTVLDIAPTAVVLEVGGVGFQIVTGPATAARLQLGERVQLHTHLAVREDALTLYGFATSADREAFRLVQTASGVGPKLALAILAVLDAHDLGQAVATSNLAALMRVPGVGKKVAERLVVELKDKVALLTALRESDLAAPAPAAADLRREQVIEGLTGLGYSAREAEPVVAAVLEELARDDPARDDPARDDPAQVDPAQGDPARGDPARDDSGATPAEISVAEVMKAALKRLARR